MNSDRPLLPSGWCISLQGRQRQPNREHHFSTPTSTAGDGQEKEAGGSRPLQASPTAPAGARAGQHGGCWLSCSTRRPGSPGPLNSSHGLGQIRHQQPLPQPGYPAALPPGGARRMQGSNLRQRSEMAQGAASHSAAHRAGTCPPQEALCHLAILLPTQRSPCSHPGTYAVHSCSSSARKWYVRLSEKHRTICV